MKQLNNANGFTLTELIISMSIVLVSVAALGVFSNLISVTQKSINQKQSVGDEKAKIISILSDRRVWQNIVMTANKPHPVKSGQNLNPSLECLRTSSVCTPGEYDLTVVGINSEMILDALDDSKGFTKEGTVCTDFNLTTPNSQCSNKITAAWKPVCPSVGPCVKPQVEIQIKMLTGVATAAGKAITSYKTSLTSLSIENPKFIPPVIRKMTMLANSSQMPAWHTPVEIDIASYVLNATYFSIKPLEGMSTIVSDQGSTVTFDGNRLKYLSPSNFHGVDRVKFRVVDEYTGLSGVGVAYVKVMTPYTWTGLSSAGSGSSHLKNFCGRVVNNECDGVSFAGAQTLYVFNENCTNCNATLESSMYSIEMSEKYFGTVTQTGVTFIGAGGFTQHGGTFNGGSTNLALNGPTTITGGRFISTSGNLAINNHITISAGATFVHNGGRANFNWQCCAPQNISVGSNLFNNISFVGTNGTHAITGRLRVGGTLTFDDRWANSGTITTGIIDAYGDVVVNQWGGGLGVVRLAGGEIGNLVQSVSSSSNSFLPGLEISSPGAKVNFSGTTGTRTSFKYVAGNVDMGTSTFRFYYTCCGSNLDIISEGMSFYNVSFDGINGQYASSGTMTVKGSLTFNDQWANGGGFNAGTIDAYGDIIVKNFGGGKGKVRIVGTASRSLSSTNGNYLPALEIDLAPSGFLKVSGTTGTRAGYKYVAGNVSFASSTFKFSYACCGSSLQIDAGSAAFYNVRFEGINGQYELLSPMYVNENLVLADTSSFGGNINGQSILVRKNVTVSGNGGGSTNIQLVGNSDQTISIDPAARLPGSSLKVAKTASAKLNLAGNIKLSSTQSFEMTSGSTDLKGYTLEIPGGNLVMDNTTITKSSGVLIVGSTTIADGAYGRGHVQP